MFHWIPREISHRILHLITLSAVSIYHAFQQVGQLAELYQNSASVNFHLHYIF